MVNTRSRTSKQPERGKKRVEGNSPGGPVASPEQTSDENSVGHPSAPQFVNVDQLEALKQVQGAVIKGIWEQMKVSDPQLGTEARGEPRRSAGPPGGARSLLQLSLIHI